MRRLKWDEDDNGDQSAGRIAFLPAVFVGLGIAFLGTVLAFIEVIAQTKSSLGPLILTGGAGIVAAAFAFKGWQRRTEAQIYTADKTAGGTT